MIKFDAKKINVYTGSPKYMIKYYICCATGNAINFTEAQMKRKYKHVDNECNRSCFAGLNQMFTKSKNWGEESKANRIMYVCEREFREMPHLNDEQIKRWVMLCRRNQLMPKNIGEHFLKTMGYIINLEKVSYNRLYMYLAAARCIQEMPQFVATMLHLVDDIGLDFFVAFPIASVFSANNTGHHIIPVTRNYSLNTFKGDMNATKNSVFNEFDLSYGVRLAKYAFSKIKETTVVDEKSKRYFGLHSQLQKIKVKGRSGCRIPREHLLKEAVVKAVRTGDLTKILNLTC